MPSDILRPPERPALTPALYALLTVLVAERMTLGGHATARAARWCCLLLVALCALSWAGRRRGLRVGPDGGVLACCACAAVASVLVAGLVTVREEAFVRSMGSSPVSLWSFEALSDALPIRGGYRCRARAIREDAPPGQVWLACPDQLERGEVVRGVGRYVPNGEDEWGRASRMQGVWGSVKVVLVESRGSVGGPSAPLLALRRTVREALAPDSSEGRAVLAGCLVADRRPLVARDLDALFATCGVAHLVAVSGSHLTVVSSLLSLALGRVRASPTTRMCLLLATTAGFVALCGAPASAVRAWLMAALSDGGKLLGRRGDALSAVCVVALAMALVDPTLSGQAGFLLSVTCVVALSLFSQYVVFLVELVLPTVRPPRSLSSELRIRLRACRRDVVRGTAASLVCLVASAPLVLTMSGRISLVGPLVALPVGSLLSLAMSMGLVGSCLAPVPLAGRLVVGMADAVAEVALGIMRVAASLPMATVAVDAEPTLVGVVLVLAAFALLVAWPLPSGRAVKAAASCLVASYAACILAWTVFAPARVCVLDVGQGDAILVQDGWHAVLVDAGPDDAAARALARQHVLRLDALVLTHLHDDHCGGVGALAGSVPCGRVMVAEGVADGVPDALEEDIGRLTDKPCVELSYGDVLHVGGFSLEMVWPHGLVTGEANPDSLVMVLRYRKGATRMTALLTGDAERDELEGVLVAGDLPDVDVLKVGHHGSDESLTPDQAKALGAELAVASAGKGNEYGHPTRECVQTLEEAGARFLCTADVGDVDIRPAPSGVRCLTTCQADRARAPRRAW